MRTPTGQVPTYSLIEGQIIGCEHNDVHPRFGTLVQVAATAKGADGMDFHFDPPSSLARDRASRRPAMDVRRRERRGPRTARAADSSGSASVA
jgi:hypothetical protein